MRQSASDAADAMVTAGPVCRRLLITAPGAIELIEERLPPLGEHDASTPAPWYPGSATAPSSPGCTVRLPRCTVPGIRADVSTSTGPGRDYPVALATSRSAG